MLIYSIKHVNYNEGQPIGKKLEIQYFYMWNNILNKPMFTPYFSEAAKYTSKTVAAKWCKKINDIEPSDTCYAMIDVDEQ